jgi:hypothetical protein
VLINDGTGRYTDTTLLLKGWFDALALGDVDVDGDLDLFFAGGALHELWLNDGAGTFSRASHQLPDFELPVARRAYVSGAVFGDLDLDGDPDLFLAATAPQGGGRRGAPVVWENVGAGRFRLAYAAAPPVFADPKEAAVADLDDDGDLDAAVACWLASSFTVILLNRYRHQMGPPEIARGATYEITVDGQFEHVFALALGARGPSIRWPGLGTWQLDLVASVWLPPVSIPYGRSTTVRLPVPNSSALVGTRIYSQGIDLGPAGRGPLHFTNWWMAEIR